MSWAEKARSALTPRIWFTKKSGEEDESRRGQQVIVRSMDSESKEDGGCWPELKEFCKAHAIECSAFALFILFGIFCIFNAFGFLGPNELTIRSDHYEHLMNVHCQFVENRNLNGREGKTDHPNATLVSLLSVVRHGDRYGLLSVSECQQLTEQENKEFDEYLSRIENIKLKSLLKIPEAMEKNPLTPKRETCKASDLTPRGAIQVFSMGRFLYNQYKDTPLLKTNKKINITLTFSNLQRTFTSGVALVSGFIDQNQTKFSIPIDFKEGFVYNGCTYSGCECNSTYEQLHEMVRKEKQGLYRLEMDQKDQHVAHQLMMEINYTSLNIDPMDIIDNVVSRYSCPKKPFPCNDDYCVSFLFFGNIFEYFSKQSEKMFDLNMGMERHYRVLSAYPILRYVGSMTRNKDPSIQFFSSHDAVIASILQILTDSGKYNDWQVYAARIVFEIYETTPDSKFLRVLYDGDDITSLLKFCNHLEFGLCPVSDFNQFLENGIFEMAGYKDFEGICRNIRDDFNFV